MVKVIETETRDVTKEERSLPRNTPPDRRSALVKPPSEVAMNRAGDAEEASSLSSKVSVRNLNFYYGGQQALFDNNIDIPEKRVTAIIGPSGCGKSTHIRVYNRIYELYRTHRAEGQVVIDGKNILSSSVDLIDLRKRVGMIFQRPTPFPGPSCPIEWRTLSREARSGTR